ncbi:tryptophan-rich sensory protein [Hoeflea sp. YIM 152468]|uniref:TspO/MBR family protein n=1 Tax=Hoeflea sp. YIM 152468 TaxID=3031759 RepID=UPI0023DA1DD6|nr:TspO/MBR family protein [Hoeflea sp. YIM 152468]MDF1610406.1 tryptophan-rich sensory protein [Hoeflea sp. YIM 152468]
MNRSHALILVLFIGLTVAGGSAIGYLTLPGPWYQGLQKPLFNPPGWIFGPVWTSLYILIGIAGARVFIRERGTWLPKLWFVQMTLNFLWSPAFFTLHRPDLALVVLIAMLVAILSFIAIGWNRDRPSALLFLPYAAWVAFAGLLNGSIWWLNPV